MINGDITTAILTLFMQTIWVDPNGVTYKIDQLPSITGTPDQLGFTPEFESIQTKLNAMIAQMEATPSS